MARSTPSAASVSAMARPIPRVAPVTIAFLPLSPRFICLLPRVKCCRTVSLISRIGEEELTDRVHDLTDAQADQCRQALRRRGIEIEADFLRRFILVRCKRDQIDGACTDTRALRSEEHTSELQSLI